MSLFRRQRPEPDRIEEFWRWWSAEGADACAAALAVDEADRLVPVLGEAVARLDRGLSWQLAAGTVTQHTLVVSAEGDPDRRAPARRWLRAAPPADGTWSYSDVRPPSPDPDEVMLTLAGGRSVALREVVVAARRAGVRLDVTVHHPAFADLAEAERLQVAFLALDAALGETAVELWVGQVATSELAPRDAFGLGPLRAFVDRMRSEYVDPDGHPAWLVLRGNGPRGPVQAAVTVPLHPASAPQLTEHVSLLVPYAEQDEDGFPTGGSVEGLRDLTRRVGELLGPDGHVVAHESSVGVRMLHAYADGGTDAADRLRRAPLEWAEGGVEVRVATDPGWSAVGHLAT